MFKNIPVWCISFLIFGIPKPVAAEIVNMTFLQLNDVYEITPVGGGKEGGLARVATIRKELQAKNPRTYTILAGDFLSPSALGTARIDDRPLAGQQMVAVLNTMGLDYVTFGNHEFDLKEKDFLERLKEARFSWISGNVFDKQGQGFPGVLPYKILTVTGEKGTPVRVGIIGITIASNPASYVKYDDPLETAKKQVGELKGKVDIIIAITHLSIGEDRQIAREIPEIDMIMGGHEHENIQQWVEGDFTPIFKADANAKSVYIHELAYDTDRKELTIDSRIKRVTDRIAEDARTAAVVREWVEKGYSAFRKQGFDPERTIAVTTVPLDGLEASVRTRSTVLTEIIAQAMFASVEKADLAIFNSGSIRIDDVIQPGKITQYDIIRILPFGGKIVAVDMKGSLLTRVLNQGVANRGNGGYLQTDRVKFDEKRKIWLINDRPIENDRFYRTAITEFLLTGREQNLGFLDRNNPDLKIIQEKEDIRFAVIRELQAVTNR